MSARPLTVLALGATLFSLLACVGTVQGERAGLGDCPKDTQCSPKTPSGLLFRGLNLWDEPGDRLGPVLLNGKFQVQLIALEGELGDYFVESSDLDVVEGSPTDDGMQLVGYAPGSALVSVVDDRGLLYDRLPVDVVEIDDIELGIVTDPDRDTLLGGCTDMIGVRLLATQDGVRLRAFDSDVRIDVSVGNAEPDVGVWDCFRVDVPEDASTVTVTVRTAGQVFERTLEVVPVSDVADCPPVVD